MPGTPPSLTGNTSGARPSEIVNVPAGYTYSQTLLACAEFFEDDEDTEHDTDFDPDILTDHGSYNTCCVVMSLTFNLKRKAAD